MRKIKTGKLYRTIELQREMMNKDDRTIDLSFSSEASVDRWFGTEILDHGPQSVRLGRLNGGGPLLLDHSTEKQIGIVDKAVIGADRNGRAVVRFGKSALAEEVYNDVLDGIRRNVSVGYQIHNMILEEEKEGVATYRATDWEPLEISIVPIPADTTVGIGRSGEGEHETTIRERKGRVMKCEHCKRDLQEGVACDCRKTSPHAHVDVEGIQAKARKEEQERVREILALGEQHKCPELARKHVNEGTSLDDFRKVMIDTVYSKVHVSDTHNPEIGMNDREKRGYSLVKAIREMSEGMSVSGLEKEASDATAKICKRDPRGFFIPQDVLNISKRAMQVADATKGGFLVGTDVLGGSMIEMLRNRPKVAQLGARTLSGLVGNVAIPRVTGGATAYWLPETGTVTASDQAFGQLGLIPHRLVGNTAYTKELLMQASVDVEAFVREDLMTVLSIEKDRATINGLGSSGEPLGILNTSGILTVTFGAAATWAKLVDFETQVANANADVGSMAYLTTPASRGKWKGIVRSTYNTKFLWDDDGRVNGYRAEVTKQVPSDKVIFGNWADVVFAEWAGIDVVVDPYSLKKQGQIEITITLYSDIGIRHAVSFCVSTDSGAQ
ncbi:MAG: phage major capsid protein [Nitrospirae bacterium]|nr:phage major capsid protein [Nitrospirota bacterium]